MSLSNIVLLFEMIIAEQKIILVSSHLAMLSLVSECLIIWMFPFYWHHILIPVLPARLLGYLQAPVPYIIGVHRNYVDNTQMGEMGPSDAVLVDIDNDTITTTANSPSIPFKERKKLFERLELSTGSLTSTPKPTHKFLGVPRTLQYAIINDSTAPRSCESTIKSRKIEDIPKVFYKKYGNAFLQNKASPTEKRSLQTPNPRKLGSVRSKDSVSIDDRQSLESGESQRDSKRQGSFSTQFTSKSLATNNEISDFIQEIDEPDIPVSHPGFLTNFQSKDSLSIEDKQSLDSDDGNGRDSVRHNSFCSTQVLARAPAIGNELTEDIQEVHETDVVTTRSSLLTEAQPVSASLEVEIAKTAQKIGEESTASNSSGLELKVQTQASIPATATQNLPRASLLECPPPIPIRCSNQARSRSSPLSGTPRDTSILESPPPVPARYSDEMRPSTGTPLWSAPPLLASILPQIGTSPESGFPAKVQPTMQVEISASSRTSLNSTTGKPPLDPSTPMRNWWNSVVKKAAITEVKPLAFIPNAPVSMPSSTNSFFKRIMTPESTPNLIIDDSISSMRDTAASLYVEEPPVIFKEGHELHQLVCFPDSTNLAVNIPDDDEEVDRFELEDDNMSKSDISTVQDHGFKQQRRRSRDFSRTSSVQQIIDRRRRLSSPAVISRPVSTRKEECKICKEGFGNETILMCERNIF